MFFCKKQHSKILHAKGLAVGLHPYRSVIHEFKAGAKISQPNVSVHIQENVVWLDVSAKERERENNVQFNIFTNTALTKYKWWISNIWKTKHRALKDEVRTLSKTRAS